MTGHLGGKLGCKLGAKLGCGWDGDWVVEYVVWADVLWLVNLVMDWLLLWGVSRLGCCSVHPGRVMAGAVFGATYAVGMLWPQFSLLYQPAGVVGCSLVMLLLVFGRQPVRRMLLLFGCFYLLSFAMCGAVIGFRSVMTSGTGVVLFGAEISWLWLLAALPVVILLSGAGVAAWRQMLRHYGLLAEVEVGFAGRSVRVACFLDSGNELREPLSGRPVLLVEVGALRDVLPGELVERLYQAVRQEGENFRPYQVLLDCVDYEWGSRLVLLPYCSVGRSGGLLLGFVPDGVRLCSSIMPGFKEVDLVLGLSLLPLAGLRGARAIVHPDLFF